MMKTTASVRPTAATRAAAAPAAACGGTRGGPGLFREGSAIYIPGRLDPADTERIPPDEVCLSLHSLELAHLGVRRAAVHEQVESILGQKDRRGHAYCMWLALLTLLYTGDLPSAHEECRQLARDPRWLGSPQHQVMLTLLRARISLLAGDGVKAAGLLADALGQDMPESVSRLAAAWLIEAQILTGRLDDAHRTLLQQELAGRLAADMPDVVHVLAARGSLHMATGHFQHALDDFTACGRLLVTWNVANPAVIPWRSRAVFAALGTGRRDLAAALADDELTAARTWGSPRGIGLALHAVAVARGDGPAVALLEEAVDLLDLAHARGELIHALHDLATLHGERGDPAAGRGRLETAAAVARESRNGLWLDRIRASLDRQDVPLLTSQELRISRLARSGYSNREIAESLFLAVRTVEFHLSSVYRKLGISGRRELHSALGSVHSGQ
ncbi:LuxR C-terminal-related transcriptional regulator [Streptomyces kunmingensis]|uniref:LuxR C-terminal-related transcriptional regulator n=1 Tax=Streptomyces kunmingensis TaxID=68225 RepID=A0ABU6CKB9_9ACTN|nr:LuxR C-terminal-related transcriptional regulator [Streptomyces kunmingensis]MEB3964800.1 LuxR C-terminal-related transcriptional regulator [Streptomyces kunmingensis]